MFRLYFVTFEGLYPVGGAYAVIGANNRGQAKKLLIEKLETENLGLVDQARKLTLDDFKIIDESVGVQIMAIGDY